MQSDTKSAHILKPNGQLLHQAMTGEPGVVNGNGKQSNNGDAAHSKKMAPSGTFEQTSFNQLKMQNNLRHDLPPTIELTQALLLTRNMEEMACRVNGLTGGESNYFLKGDYIADTSIYAERMKCVNRLINNIGTSDKASNFFLEQKSLLKAQSIENREIRELIDEEVVDGLEYIRMKEQIAETKSRAKELLDIKFSSDEEDEVESNGKQKTQDDTQEDSEEAIKKREITKKKIKSLIKQLRKDAKAYLSYRDHDNVDEIPLHKIWNKLRKNERYMKKRETKALEKGVIDTIQSVASQLNEELKKVKEQTLKIKKNKNELSREVQFYEQVHGLDKRLKSDSIGKSISELDSLPMTSKAYELQNILFNYCGVTLKGRDKIFAGTKSKDIFGRIKKLPQKSTLLQCYQDQGENKGSFTQNENSITNQARKKNVELVKVIGIEPEQLFQTLDKYKVRIDRMPKFSNVFERAEPIIPGLGMTVAGSLITSNQAGQMSFARVDGRNVISLQFNPYELDDPQKKKVYESAVKDLVEQREKIKSISKQAKEKQEQSNIKRAWLNIVKKDIPKAFRGYQKYKADLDNNTKKQSQACLKEVRKKALKTQRLCKETTMRAKKLTREMMNFWKRRDKELADLKKRKEKFEKEIKRKQEEEKENQLQKKRLEFIMNQSEIYAHFMSKKLGLHDEQTKQRKEDIDEEHKDRFQRVDIDEATARTQVASIINDNRQRVVNFDAEVSNKKSTKFQNIKEDDLVIENFDNPDPAHSQEIEPPKSFKGKLKDYQLKGLRWLDNLYEQGINGILADEMGLGKTIQAISLLAHLVESKGIWGPFLVIVPVTTLHNWQNELSKFCPSLKVLPYFGSPEERKKLGRFLDPKNLYNPGMQINVLLTSYNLIVNNSKDQQKLIRVKWHYMILDEAQAIKNNLSRRWKILLQFNTRNRLLLTGTPIQNTMAELWALLHFIMPKLFDSHEQFQEWFSKDIEQHSQNQGEINKHQLKRLHLVLKPFMLRRLKKDVEQEIGPKTEFESYCEMTHRQRVLYQRIKSKISTKDLFQLVDSKQKMENLMNLVMQFRKVCNHPELFERRVGRIPFSFRSLQQGMTANPAFSTQPDIRASMRNPIFFEIPKLIYDECFLITDNMTQLFRKVRKGVDNCYAEVSLETHMRFFNIFNTLNLHEEIFNSNGKSGTFGILRLLQKSNRWSLGDLSYLFVADPLVKQIAMMHYYHQKCQKRVYLNIHNSKGKVVELNYNSYGSSVVNNGLDILVMDFVRRDESSIFNRQYRFVDQIHHLHLLTPMIPNDLNDFCRFSLTMKNDLDIYVNKCLAETVQFQCKSGSFNRFISSVTNGGMQKKLLVGKDFKPKCELSQGRIGRDRSAFLVEDSSTSYKNGPPTGYSLFDKGIIGDLLHEKGACLLELPNYSRLVTDCAKMQFLDKLLGELHRGNHRCLIFCQMTRMLDILEDFLSWKKYTYFRMDGSTSIPDRRYMVEEYQKNPDIFAFLLSTRAGGLGVNLTGADTVIFYDNDWNPTMDAQATDRAHRIGQTKAVSVYRIITKGSVEEKIVKRARQKQHVQGAVYGGNNLKADVFKPKDVVDMLLDDQEQNELKERSQKFLKTKRIKKKVQINTSDSHQFMTDEGANREEDEVMQINTFTEDKPQNPKTSTPKASNGDKPPKKEESKKPGRKAGDKASNQPKQPIVGQSIFSTVRQEKEDHQPKQASAGPFSVFTVSKPSNQKEAQKPLFAVSSVRDETNENMEEEEEEEPEEDGVDEEEVAKFLKILEDKGNDEDEDESSGDQFEYNDDEGNNKHDDESRGGVGSKTGKVKKEGKVVEKMEDDDEPEDEEMDEY